MDGNHNSIGNGLTPEGIAFDSSNGNVYVFNYYSKNVSVISGTTNKVIGKIPVGSYPEGIALDPLNGYIYDP